jgi:hypothetical protein
MWRVTMKSPHAPVNPPERRGPRHKRSCTEQIKGGKKNKDGKDRVPGVGDFNDISMASRPGHHGHDRRPDNCIAEDEPVARDLNDEDHRYG